MGGRNLLAWASLGLLAVTLAVPAAAPQSAKPSSKPWVAPRTSWGDPDFSGLWNYATMTPLERPQAFAGKDVLTDAEAAAYEKQTIARQEATNNTAGPDWWDEGTRHLTERRTSLIVDPPNGRVPPLTPDAQKRAAARTAANRARGPADGPEDLGLNVRCLVWSTAGPPMLPGVYNNNVQFIQTRDHIVIVNEMIHDARIVPMDGRPHGTVRSWMGDSRGRWDGETLVVDTINFNEKAAFRGSTESLHLVERFTRVSDGTIRYKFTVEDPATWTRPWTAMVPMTKIEGTMLEYACHEGNERSMEGILRAARVQDK
ncbi:MAG: hypothetical protein LAO77_04470 [Acidobacteriia bacterium]|nr:hypothetical protein [Terriglobia bacterium]